MSRHASVKASEGAHISCMLYFAHLHWACTTVACFILGAPAVAGGLIAEALASG